MNDNTIVTETVTGADQNPGNVTKETEAPKTITMTQEEFDAKINKAYAKFQRKAEEAAKEAERLASLSAEEKFKEERATFEQQKKEFERERLLNETRKQLMENNLSVDFAEQLVGQDADSTFNNINTFKQKWDMQMNIAVDTRLKGKTPTGASSTPRATLTMDDVKNMSTPEILNMMKTDPDAISNAMKNNK